MWEFWDEYGKNRERIGELIQRVGMANFLDAIGLDPAPEMVMRAARQPLHLCETGGKMTPQPKRITDIGPPNYEKFLPPVIKRNYGQWKYHETLAPGVLCHVAESGEKLYTVRAGLAAPAERPHHPPLRRPGGQVLRRLSAFHQPQQRGISARRCRQYRAAEEGPARRRLSGGRHQQQHQQHRPHAGLGALPLLGHRRLGPGEVHDGCALSTISWKRSCRPSCASRWPAA